MALTTMTLTPLRFVALRNRIRRLARSRSQRFPSALLRAGDLFGRRHLRRQAGLPAAQRFRDERIGQDETGLGDQAQAESRRRALPRPWRRPASSRRVLPGHATQDAAEALAAGNRLARLDLGVMAGPAREVARHAPAAGRCPATTPRDDRPAESGSSTSSTGETARLTSSQSSTVIEPSGRSAMICTVQPFCAVTRTRTSR